MAWRVTAETAVSEAAMFHGYVVERQASQTIATGVPELISWDTTTYDTDDVVGSLPVDEIGFWTNQLLVRAACQVQFAGHATGARQVVLNIGGESFAQIFPSTGSVVAPKYQVVSWLAVPVVPGTDTVSVEVTHTAGVDLDVLNAWLSVQIVKTPFGRP